MTASERAAAVAQFRDWLRQQGYSPIVVADYGGTVARWLESGLTGTAWLAAQLEASRPEGGGYPTATAKTYRRRLLAFYTMLGRDPTELRLPRVHRYRRPGQQHALPPAVDARLLTLIDQLPEPHRTLIWMLRHLGLRVSEACALRTGDFDLRARPALLVLRDTKTVHAAAGDAPDQLALPTHVLERLRSYLATRPPDVTTWLFPGGSRAGHACKRTVHRHLAALAEGLGVRITPHTLRHTMATRMAEHGVPQAHIQAALRHKSPRSTEVYQHHVAAHKDVADALSRASSSS